MSLKVISFLSTFTLISLNPVLGQRQCPTIPNSATTAGIVMFPGRLPDKDHFDRVVSYDGMASYNCTYDTECSRRISCIGMEVPCCASGTCQCLYCPNFRCPSALKLAVSARSGFCNKNENDYVYNSLAIYRGSSDSDNQALTITASPASEATGGYAILEAYASTSLPENYQYHVSWYMQFNLSPRTTNTVTGMLRSMLKVMKSRDIMDAIEPRVLDEMFQLRYGNENGSLYSPEASSPSSPPNPPTPSNQPEPETNQLSPPIKTSQLKLPLLPPSSSSSPATN